MSGVVLTAVHTSPPFASTDKAGGAGNPDCFPQVLWAPGAQGSPPRPQAGPLLETAPLPGKSGRLFHLFHGAP